MVRINLINPKQLTDQHLIAEYNEILMLLGYVRKYPNYNTCVKKRIPKSYCLGKGHILFFKNKLIYLKKRHELLKKEMIKRWFKPTKKVNLSKFNRELKHDWKPKKNDFKIIKLRLKEKINKKSDYYQYYHKKRSKKFLLDLLK
ncbi:MAG: pyrimidine dimer DNA glycosylase/endonuclease V [Candidatus Woesearchaeota archaeon]